MCVKKGCTPTSLTYTFNYFDNIETPSVTTYCQSEGCPIGSYCIMIGSNVYLDKGDDD